jgi:hypothetical protein
MVAVAAVCLIVMSPRTTRAAEASGFYQQQVAKVKDTIAGAPVKEEYEVSLAPRVHPSRQMDGRSR